MLLLFLIFIGHTSPSQGTTSSALDNVLNKYQTLEIEMSLKQNHSFSLSTLLENRPDEKALSAANVKAKTLAETGLEWNSSYIENFNAVVIQDADFLYRRKFQTGLTFNVLHGGVVASYFQKKANEAQNRLQSVYMHNPILASYFTGLRREVLSVFNQNKIVWVNKLLEIQTEYINVLKPAYNDKLINEYEWISEYTNAQNMQMQLSFLESMDKILQQSNQTSTTKIFTKFAIPDFDAEVLSFLDSVNQKKKEEGMLAFKEKVNASANPASKLGLNMRINYNLYDFGVNQATRLRDIASFSVNTSVPFSTFYPRYTQQMQEREMYETVAMLDDQQSKNVMRYKEYLRHMKGFLELENKLTRLHEKIRANQVKRSLGDESFDIKVSIEDYRNYYETKVSSLEALELVYDDIIQLMIQYPEENVMQFVSAYEVPTMASNVDFDEIYVWSSTFTNAKPNEVLEFALNSKASTFMVSLPSDTAKRRLCNAFIEDVIHNKKSVHWLFGNNNKIDDPDYAAKMEAYFSRLVPKGISALHLDIEPHTLPDWKVRKTEYLNELVVIFQKAKLICEKNNWKLCVSLPLSYPTATYESIYQIVDYVYLMSYEHADAQYLLRKIKPIQDINPSKTKVCIRTADFTTADSLQSFAKELKIALGVKGLVLHDLKGYMQLEKTMR